MIGGMRQIFGSGALGTAERVAIFAEQRNSILADNIANINTPGYRTRDLPVAEFQEMLAAAFDRSRKNGGPLRMQSTRNISVDSSGRVSFRTIERDDADLLYHDGGNRSIEQEMTELAKNALLHRVAGEIVRKQFGMLHAAIRERP